MSVYVDEQIAWPVVPRWRYGSVSHLTADTDLELHEFAARLGLKRWWCSDETQPNSRKVHYDLSPAKRAQAVRLGAVEQVDAPQPGKEAK